jgi:hypothetical protein
VPVPRQECDHSLRDFTNPFGSTPIFDFHRALKPRRDNPVATASPMPRLAPEIIATVCMDIPVEALR